MWRTGSRKSRPALDLIFRQRCVRPMKRKSYTAHSAGPSHILVYTAHVVYMRAHAIYMQPASYICGSSSYICGPCHLYAAHVVYMRAYTPTAADDEAADRFSSDGGEGVRPSTCPLSTPAPSATWARFPRSRGGCPQRGPCRGSPPGPTCRSAPAGTWF